MHVIGEMGWEHGAQGRAEAMVREAGEELGTRRDKGEGNPCLWLRYIFLNNAHFNEGLPAISN